MADGWPLATAFHFPDADALLPAQHVKDLYLKARCRYEGRYDPIVQRVADPLPLAFSLRRVLAASVPTCKQQTE